MIDRNCAMCGKLFKACGNTRTCSARCSYEQMKIKQKEMSKRRNEKRRETRNKKPESTLLEMQQKAREAGMSYGMYMAVTKGGMAVERSEEDG